MTKAAYSPVRIDQTSIALGQARKTPYQLKLVEGGIKHIKINKNTYKKTD